MYPSTELKRLADRKRLLVARIAVRRESCVDCCEELAETLRRVDEWRERITHWTGLVSTFFPYFLTARAELGKPRAPGRLGGLLRWAGLGWKLVKGLKPLTYAFRGE